MALDDKVVVTCGVTGLPALTLLDATGRKLPTHARFSGTPGTLSAVLVTLNDGSTGGLYVGVVLANGGTLGRTDGKGAGTSN